MNPNSSPTVLPRVVIIGGGFGGINVAKRLKSACAHVILIDRSNHHLFQPLLYQVATAGLSPADIAMPIRSILSKQEQTEVIMAEVIGVDRASKCVLLKDGSELGYDYLVIATGSQQSYFGKDHWSAFAPGLKSLADATRIRRDILLAFESAERESDPVVRDSLLTFIIVGGGPTGVEMAGSIAELAHVVLAEDFRHINPRSARIILIEAGPRVLSSFPEDLSRKAEHDLKRLGVEIRTGVRVEELDAQGVTVAGTRISARTLVWAAGVAASPAGRWLGAETDRIGRVKVEPDLTLPGHPEIFVIGDTAAASDSSGKLLPGLAPVAIQQGKFVADQLLRLLRGKSERRVFHYFDKGNLATIGRSRAVGEAWGLHFTGIMAWLAWTFVHVLYLIGFRNRVLVMFQWAWSYFTYKRGARLIIRDDKQATEI